MFIRNVDRTGTAYIEFQICTMPKNSTSEQIVDINNVKHWKTSSIYVSEKDSGILLNAYGTYLIGCLHNNLSYGALDIFGINYFTKQQTEKIVENIFSSDLPDCAMFTAFLNAALSENGFYVLGI